MITVLVAIIIVYLLGYFHGTQHKKKLEKITEEPEEKVITKLSDDKIEWLTGDILNLIFTPEFLRHSFDNERMKKDIGRRVYNLLERRISRTKKSLSTFSCDELISELQKWPGESQVTIDDCEITGLDFDDNNKILDIKS